MKIKLFGKPKPVIFALITFLLVNFFVFNQTALAANYNDHEFQIFQLINSERRNIGLNNLEWDDQLADVARQYSRQMERENFFEHADLNGKTVVDRAKDAHLKHWSKIGENLFFCERYRNFDAFAVRGWMKSPTHRDNILDESWTTTGIGIAESRDGRIYVTQVFIER